MQANFFKQLVLLDITGNLHLTIAKDNDNHLVVSIILQNEQCADNARKMMSPLILKGTADELDNGFFENISRPMQAASGLLVSMEAFMKQLEEVRQHSAMEKEKTEKEKRMKEETNKKYKEAMQKVDELEKEGRYRDAWMKLPDAVQFPEQSETIHKRKSSLSAKFAPDLFGAAETETTVALPMPENTFFSEFAEPEEISDDFMITGKKIMRIND